MTIANPNRKLVEDYFVAWSQGDLRKLEAYMDPAYSFNPPPGITPDRKGALEMSRMFHKAFPDLKLKLGPFVVEGERVALRFVASATHKGEFMGIPPTGRRTETTGLALVTCRGGRIVEDLTEFDALGLLTKLGAIPELASVQH